MDKDLMKKKFGLPPMPPTSTGPQKRKQLRKREYSQIGWDKYFTNKYDVQTKDGDSFRVYEAGSEGPVVFFLHGGGFSGLSWALLSDHLTKLVKCRCLALDQRGHGDTVTNAETDLSADQLAKDVDSVLSQLYKSQIPPVILVGHSMGGAVAVHVAAKKLIPTIIGLAVIDVVEGTAIEALASMQSFLRSRPKYFDTLDRAIEWSVRSGQILNPESARVSMTGQLKAVEVEDIVAENNSKTVNSTSAFDAIPEDGVLPSDERVSIASPNSRASRVSQASSQSVSSVKYTWRVDLSQTEPYWRGWFEGLSNKFLSCQPPKMLILAGADRLDKELTIGQMQGKFQMNLLPQCGHAVHEDVPDKVADILANFMVRYKAAEPLENFQRQIPGC